MTRLEGYGLAIIAFIIILLSLYSANAESPGLPTNCINCTIVTTTNGSEASVETQSNHESGSVNSSTPDNFKNIGNPLDTVVEAINTLNAEVIKMQDAEPEREGD